MEIAGLVIFLLMGMAGSDKTTIGRKQLARALGWTFRDAGQSGPFANLTTCSATPESYRLAVVADPVRAQLLPVDRGFALFGPHPSQRRGQRLRSTQSQSQLAALAPPQQPLRLNASELPDGFLTRIRQASGL